MTATRRLSLPFSVDYLDAADALLAAASGAFAPTLGRYLPAERAPRAAEWCARMVLTVLVPDGQAVIADDDVVRDLVRQFVLPGLVPDSLRTVQSKG